MAAARIAVAALGLRGTVSLMGAAGLVAGSWIVADKAKERMRRTAGNFAVARRAAERVVVLGPKRPSSLRAASC